MAYNRKPTLDPTKSWEERYKNLEEILIHDAMIVLKSSPIRPAMFIGSYQDNRDAHFLMFMIMDALRTMCLLKHRDETPFALKWGVGAQSYHRNIDHEKSHEENLKKIKEMADDFLKWIDS